MVIWLYYGNIIVVSEENMFFLRFFRAISLVMPIVWMMITQLLRHLQINQAVGRPDVSGWRDCRGGQGKTYPLAIKHGNWTLWLTSCTASLSPRIDTNAVLSSSDTPQYHQEPLAPMIYKRSSFSRRNLSTGNHHEIDWQRTWSVQQNFTLDNHKQHPFIIDRHRTS